jgi:hypothetical protein
MDEDIPKKTIVGLLILTVVISMACTWVVLDKTVAPQIVYIGDNSAGAQAKVDINPSEPVDVPKAISGGQIAVNIK